MCWRCDEPEEDLHDAHFWTARATLHQRHVWEWQSEMLDRNWAKMGFRRVKFDRIATDRELVVQPMVEIPPPPPLVRLNIDELMRDWTPQHEEHVSDYYKHRLISRWTTIQIGTQR